MKGSVPPIVVSVFLLACQLATVVTPTPTATVTAIFVPTIPPTTATATTGPPPTATFMPSPTPPSTVTPVSGSSAGPQPVGTPVPVPSLPPPPEGYILKDERWIDSYLIRFFSKESADFWAAYENIVSIFRDGFLLEEIENVFGLDDLTGTDITGEGHPDLIVETFTGGAHCCFSTLVFDLGPEFTKVLESPLSNCSGMFRDADGDGVYEFITCDDLFAYAYCPYASSPLVRVIMKYKEGYGYFPAGHRFADLYADDIARHTQLAEDGAPGMQGEWDGTSKCSVLPLVLDYLYSGQPKAAWEALDRYYRESDKLFFWAEVLDAVKHSPLYVAGGALPDIPLPAHYYLFLTTPCDPDQKRIALLTEEQSLTCSTAVPRWDIFTFENYLARTPLLGPDESLKLLPEGCYADCRLAVWDYARNTETGEIRLVNGEVYRVNDDGTESDHWLLRGDLTWETVH